MSQLEFRDLIPTLGCYTVGMAVCEGLPLVIYKASDMLPHPFREAAHVGAVGVMVVDALILAGLSVVTVKDIRRG